MPEPRFPDYDVNPDDLDDDLNPTTAWTLGEHLDEQTAARLRNLIDNGNA